MTGETMSPRRSAPVRHEISVHCAAEATNSDIMQREGCAEATCAAKWLYNYNTLPSHRGNANQYGGGVLALGDR